MKKPKPRLRSIPVEDWISIDNYIRSVAAVSKTKKALFATMKKRYVWNDSQCKAAINPIIEKEYPKLK